MSPTSVHALITLRLSSAVWHGSRQTQDDGSGQGNVDVDLSDLDLDVGTDLQADVADEDSSEDLPVRPDRLPRCVPRLVLYKRSDRFFNPSEPSFFVCPKCAKADR